MNMGRAGISSLPITMILLRMKFGIAKLAKFTAVSTFVNEKSSLPGPKTPSSSWK